MTRPNYTQISNYFLDNRMDDVSGNATKVFLAISRKTIGFHKDTDPVAYSQIMEMTGIVSRTTVKKAITELVDAGLIEAEKKAGGTTVYSLNMTSPETVLPTSPETVPHQSRNCTGTSPETVLTKESSKETTQKKYTEAFETFWNDYPRKVDKGGAFKTWTARLKEGVDPQELMSCLVNYKKKLKADKTEPSFILHAKTFLNADHRHEDFAEGGEAQEDLLDYEDKNGNVFKNGVKTGHWDGGRFIPDLNQGAR